MVFLTLQVLPGQELHLFPKVIHDGERGRGCISHFTGPGKGGHSGESHGEWTQWLGLTWPPNAQAWALSTTVSLTPSLKAMGSALRTAHAEPWGPAGPPFSLGPGFMSLRFLVFGFNVDRHMPPFRT